MKKQNPLVSVIVPIYGVEKYLEKCILSIINQTYKNIEIILVDDGSKDQCPIICDKYSQLDKRIIVIHKRNGGLVSARKAGIHKAKGNYIQFVDGDDWISDKMIANMVKNALQTNADIIMCNYYKVKTKNIKHDLHLKPGIYSDKNYQRLITKRSLFSGTYKPHYNFGIEPVVWNKMFKLSILRDIMDMIPDKITYGEDVAFVFTVLLKTKSIHVTNQYLYFYRINPNGMSKAYSKTQSKDTITLIKYLNQKLNINSGLYQQLKYYHISITMANLNNEAKLSHWRDFWIGYKKLKNFIKSTGFLETIENTDFSCVNKRVTFTILLIKMDLMLYVYIILIIKNRLNWNKQ